MASTIDLQPARDSDIGAIGALVNRSERHDRIPRATSVDELREDVDRTFVDLAEDTRIAMLDGQVAGWSLVWNPPSTDSLERAYLFGTVDPVHRGRGVGRALVGWSVARARERLSSRDHGLPCYVRLNAYDWQEANLRLFARFGFEPVRWFEELARPLGHPPDVAFDPGVVMEAWPDGRDGEILRVRNDAFADHWGSAPLSPEDWDKMVHGHGARFDLSVVALDRATGDVVGLCLNHAYPEDDEVTGRREAWIENVATARQWRGRGIASAMIAWSLAAFEGAGFTHALLGVDADSPTGAARLYRNLGFVTERRSITMQIEVVR